MPQVSPGLQLGTGSALETTRLEAATMLAAVAVLAADFGVRELAAKPAKTKAKTERRTMVFMTRLPPGRFFSGR
jgi:hypothetical protein